MNHFAHCGASVLDAKANAWACNVWHPFPVPIGVEESNANYEVKYWLVRSPIPPPPKVKTEAELDEEALDAWRKDPNHQYCFKACWYAACAYARAQKDQK